MSRAKIVETLRMTANAMQSTNMIRAREIYAISDTLSRTALPPNPDVRQIIKAWLEENGYDGLCNYITMDECECSTDDIAPCGEIQPDCQAGYHQYHTADSESECGGVCCHCIGPNKPSEPEVKP